MTGPDDAPPRYHSRWVLLANALRMLLDAGFTNDSARASLCSAISDGAVKIRIKLGKQTSTGRTHRTPTFTGDDVDIPTDLRPDVIDFESSRPLLPWFIPREKHSDLKGWWSINLIRLYEPDVMSAVLHGRRATPVGTETGKASPRRLKSQAARERAKGALRELYPSGVPDQTAVSNVALCAEVGRLLKAKKLQDVSDDTILRAAARRK